MKHNDAVHSLELIFEWNGATDEEKTYWIEKFLHSPTEIQEALLEFFASYPGEISRFTRLQKMKEAVFASHDRDKWKSVMDEELTYFDSLLPNNNLNTII